MSNHVNDIESFERFLFDGMITLVVRRSDGMDVIRSALEMGILRDPSEDRASLKWGREMGALNTLQKCPLRESKDRP